MTSKGLKQYLTPQYKSPLKEPIGLLFLEISVRCEINVNRAVWLGAAIMGQMQRMSDSIGLTQRNETIMKFRSHDDVDQSNQNCITENVPLFLITGLSSIISIREMISLKLEWVVKSDLI